MPKLKISRNSTRKFYLCQEQLRVNEVYIAVKYFCGKFRVRHERLIINMEKSKKHTHEKFKCAWRDDCRRMIAEIDQKNK